MHSFLQDLKGSTPSSSRYLRLLVLFTSLFLLSDWVLATALRSGLKRYFGLEVPAQVLLIGHSHTVLGIDKPGLEAQLGVPVAKYARQGANVSNRLAMLRHYLDTQATSVKVVVYDIDAHTFTNLGLSKNSHRLFYPFMDNPQIASYLRNQTTPAEYWPKRLIRTTRFDEVTVALAMRGHLGKWTNMKQGMVDAAREQYRVTSGDFTPIGVEASYIKDFEQTIQEVRGRDIHLVLAYIPVLDIYRAAEPRKHDEIVQRFQTYAQRDPGITFIDYNPRFDGRHDLFFDRVHLNPAGQKVMTQALAEDLEQIMESIPESGSINVDSQNRK